MGFDEFLGNQRIVSALRGMLAPRARAQRAAFHRAARHREIHAGANVRAGRELRAPARTISAASAPPAVECARLADPAPLIEAGLAERGESADAATVERTPLILETHPDVWLIVPDPGAAAHSRRAADDSRGPVARRAARRVFQAAGPAARFHSRRRGHHALERRRPLPENSRGAARIRHADSAGGHARIRCCRRSVRAACNFISRRCPPSRSRHF